MVKVFAVVVSFNGVQWIEKCLSSLVKSCIPLSIIVVDNHSDDETVSCIKQRCSYVDLIEINRNVGFGKANNIGIKKALEKGADYFFLLNQDAWIEPNTIKQLIEIHQYHHDYGTISPMHLNADYSALDYNFSKYIGPEYCLSLYSDIYLEQVKDVYPVGFVNAAAWIMSRACVEKVGLFDPVFFHYGEDRNYCQRVWYHGFKIGVCPRVRIIHDRGGRKGVAEQYGGNSETRRLTLISLCDIRSGRFNSRYFSYILGGLRKGVYYMVTLRFKELRSTMSDCKYFIVKRRAIRASRLRNAKSFPSLTEGVYSSTKVH